MIKRVYITLRIAQHFYIVGKSINPTPLSWALTSSGLICRRFSVITKASDLFVFIKSIALKISLTKPSAPAGFVSTHFKDIYLINLIIK